MKKCAALTALVLLAPALACGGFVIEQKVSFSAPMGMMKSEGTETIYLKGEKMRIESNVETTGMMMGGRQNDRSITIIRPDKGVIWEIDTEETTYMQSDIGVETMSPMGGFDFEVKDIEVVRTGENREIAGYDCEAVKANLVFETRAGEEVVTQPAELTIWMANDAEDIDEVRDFWERVLDVTQGRQQGFPMADTMEELWAKITDVEGVPLGMEMSMTRAGMTGVEDEKRMREMMKHLNKRVAGEDAEEEMPSHEMRFGSEVTSIKKKSIDDSMFEIPDGFSETTWLERHERKKPE
jgi:hypothetical protein